MNNAIIKETRVCLGCKTKYEAHIGSVVGIRILFGQGYCPTCCQKRYEEAERKEAESQALTLKNKRENWRIICGIPMRFQESRFGNFDTRIDKSINRILNECQKYVMEFSLRHPTQSKSIVMYSFGIWGLGKTHIACAVAHALLDKWQGETELCPVYFASEPQLFTRIRATFNNGRDGI